MNTMMKSWLRAALIAVTGVSVLSAGAAAAEKEKQPQKPWRNLSYELAAESNALGEASRMDRIARQRALTQRMAQFAGYGPYLPGVFEPWPYVPGDIWGYRMPPPIEQPIGHESRQVDRNTWTYRPLYLGPAPRPVLPMVRPAPQVAAPRPVVIQPGRMSPSAREF